jgi:ribosomal protein S18 acetylase RimI-like enzyme
VKPFDPAVHRNEAREVLRGLLSRGRVPYAPHPGEWDWWTFHADPRDRIEQVIGPGALASIAINEQTSEGGEVAAFGLDADAVIELGRTILPGIRFEVSHVSVADTTRVADLKAAGFESSGLPGPLFERGTADARPRSLPGFEIRPLRGESEHVARADAARLAFASTLDPDEHRARYLRFMRSPAYALERDLVAVAADGTIAAFVTSWLDAELSLGQLEPVGTRPEFQRRGLARALIQESLARMATAGIERARVMTGGTNDAAQRTYLDSGFRMVDQVGAYLAPASFESRP